MPLSVCNVAVLCSKGGVRPVCNQGPLAGGCRQSCRIKRHPMVTPRQRHPPRSTAFVLDTSKKKICFSTPPGPLQRLLGLIKYASFFFLENKIYFTERGIFANVGLYVHVPPGRLVCTLNSKPKMRSGKTNNER